MKCLECQDWLQRRLDGESGGDVRALEQHLLGCASCREQSAAATRLQHGLRGLVRPAPPADFTRRVVGAVVKDRAVRRQRMTRRLYVTAALAASVFLMLLLNYGLPPQPTPMPPPTPGPAQKAEAPAPPAPPVARSTADDSLVGRTREQLRVLLPALALDVPVDRLPAMTELEPLDPAAQSFREAGQEVTASLQTVTRSARQALDYFSRELPVLDLGDRRE